MNENIRIILADDHALLREMLKERLGQEPDISVVASVGDAGQAVTQALSLRPDVVVLDIDMPGESCFDAARTIKSQLPQTHVLFLSAFYNDRHIGQAIAVEASGYLTKAESPQRIIEAIREIVGGAVCYSPEIQARIVFDDGGRHRLSSAAQTRASTLTGRELVVLRYIARGLSKKEIATQMYVTAAAVDRHCTRIMAKLDIHDRVELARFAIREGLAEA